MFGYCQTKPRCSLMRISLHRDSKCWLSPNIGHFSQQKPSHELLSWLFIEVKSLCCSHVFVFILQEMLNQLLFNRPQLKVIFLRLLAKLTYLLSECIQWGYFIAEPMHCTTLALHLQTLRVLPYRRRKRVAKDTGRHLQCLHAFQVRTAVDVIL